MTLGKQLISSPGGRSNRRDYLVTGIAFPRPDRVLRFAAVPWCPASFCVYRHPGREVNIGSAIRTKCSQEVYQLSTSFSCLELQKMSHQSIVPSSPQREMVDGPFWFYGRTLGERWRNLGRSGGLIAVRRAEG